LAAETPARAIRIGSCSGWHHARRGEVVRLPVILCAPFGVEALATHLGWRDLADRLAGQGHDVIRFDYEGTGLSPGDWLEAGAVARWEASIVSVIDAVRTALGADKIVLAGLRLGATLAAQVAQGRQDVAAFVALAPVVSGRRYARELKALAQMQGEAGSSGAGIAVYGYALPQATLDALATLEMSTLKAPAPQGLVAARNEGEAGLAKSWGFKACAFDDFERFAENPTHSQVPEALFKHLAQWCAALEQPAALGTAHFPAAVFTAPDGHIEEAVRFGAQDHLSGVLLRPATPDPRLGVVIANAGRNPAAGWGRQGMELARLAVQAGHVALLFDLSGIGDSLIPPESEGEVLYSDTHKNDLLSAVGALKAQLVERFFVVGACSSAYAALQVAAEIEGLAGLALINLLRFHWRKGESLDVADAQTSFRPTEAYGRRLFQRETWSRLIRGDIAVLPIAKTILGRVANRARQPLLALLDTLGLRPSREREALRWLEALDARKVRTTFIHGPEDPGVAEMTAYFGTDAKLLAPLAHVQWVKIDGGDHSFSSVQGRAIRDKLLLEEMAAVQPPA